MKSVTDFSLPQILPHRRFHPTPDFTPPQISPCHSFHGHTGSTPCQIGGPSRPIFSADSVSHQSRRAPRSHPPAETPRRRKCVLCIFCGGGDTGKRLSLVWGRLISSFTPSWVRTPKRVWERTSKTLWRSKCGREGVEVRLSQRCAGGMFITEGGVISKSNSNSVSGFRKKGLQKTAGKHSGSDGVSSSLSFSYDGCYITRVRQGATQQM